MVYLFLFETAAWISEARDAKILDLDLNDNRIKMKILKQGEKKRHRVFQISDRLKALILQHQLELGLTKDDIILSKRPGRPAVSRQAIDKQLRLDCGKLSIPLDKAYPHTWRHTRAIQILKDAGQNASETLLFLKRFLGHSSLNSTLVNTQFVNLDVDNLIKGVNERIGLL